MQRDDATAGRDLSSTELYAKAEAAETRGDFELSVLLWEVYQRRFEDDALGFLHGGLALERLGTIDRAIQVLSEGMEHFPDHEDLAVQQAWLLLEHRDPALAAARWTEVRRSFPDNVDGYLGGGAACRRLEMHDEADAIYRAGLERFPDNEDLYQGYAWSAEERKDFAEAAQRWQQLKHNFPSDVQYSLRQAECLLALGTPNGGHPSPAAPAATLPDREADLAAHAWAASGERQWAEALRRWERVLTRDPNHLDARRCAAEALMELGRSVEALGVLAPALRLYPDHAELAEMHGWVATRLRNLKLASEIWTDVRARFPDRVAGYHGHATALRDQTRFEEADALMEKARREFPHDLVTAMDYARIPERHRAWPSAVHRWHGVVAGFPMQAGGYVGLANALMKAGYPTEAVEAFELGRVPCADDFELAAGEADFSAEDAQWPEALERWTAVQARFPDDPRAAAGMGATLRNSGQLEASAGTLSAALKRFPDRLDLLLEFAKTLNAQRHWSDALGVWASLKQRFPDNGAVRIGITETLGQAMADQNAHGTVSFLIPPELLESEAVDQDQVQQQAAILKRFESLGDTCEFGIVQRLYGVEHVSLLRWARTTPDDLVKALDSKLAGVGDPENTIIDILHNEYITEDRRYVMQSHTFTSPLAEPMDVFAPEQCRRMQWLRARLIDSLTSASRIFIYKSNAGVNDAQILALDSAIKQYCPQNVLFCVKLEDRGHPAGTVESIHEGLFVGYIDKFSTVDVSVNIWLTLCGRVAASVPLARPQPIAG